MTPHFGATSTAVAAAAGGVVLSETQLGSMALRAKQQRTKAEQDKQLLQVCDPRVRARMAEQYFARTPPTQCRRTTR